MIDLDDAVLLPIDMQRAFDAAAWPARWNSDLDKNGLQILTAWRKAGKPVVHVRHDSVEPGSTLSPDLEGNKFREGFEPQSGERVVSKSVNAAFIGTDLDLHLRRIGARKIVTFGISTDMCVSTTIRVGSNLGWPVVLIEDACDCFELPGPGGVSIPARSVHEAHVATLGFEFCTVTTTGALLTRLQN